MISRPGRALVGENRRRKTRRKLIESALAVVAERGLEGQIVDDVVRRAGVSRATYYNYFKTSSELVLAIAEDLTNDLIALVIFSADRHAAPLDRLASGVRTFLSLVGRYPQLAAFLSRAAYHAVRPGSYAYAVLERDAGGAMDDGTLSKVRLETAMDLIVGPILTTMGRMGSGTVSRAGIDHVAFAILLSLGARPARAKRAVSLQIARPRPAPGSLLERGAALARMSLHGDVSA